MWTRTLVLLSFLFLLFTLSRITQSRKKDVVLMQVSNRMLSIYIGQRLRRAKERFFLRQHISATLQLMKSQCFLFNVSTVIRLIYNSKANSILLIPLSYLYLSKKKWKEKKDLIWTSFWNITFIRKYDKSIFKWEVGYIFLS